MKVKLQYLLTICFLLTVITVNAQITYASNFNAAQDGWQSEVFERSDALSCSGAGTLVANMYEFETFASLISPSLGISNGGEVTLSFMYKILDYVSNEPITNDQDWGNIKIYYGITPVGPFRLLQTIDTSNHIPSESCETKTLSFYAPVDSPVFIKVDAEIDNLEIDYNVFFDEVVVTQAVPATCSGTPDAASAEASRELLCNGNTATISLFPVYSAVGLSYQWQSSTDNISYTNIEDDGTLGYYNATQTQSMWYRAVITCVATGESVTSEPVMVLNSGIDCLCDVSFSVDVEPITLVEFAGINNVSSAVVNGSPALEDFTGLAPGEVILGQTYEITLEGNTNDPFGDGFQSYFSVFIDWNRNGDLTEEGERYNIGILSNSTGSDSMQITGQIAVPVTASQGLTAMRVFKLSDSYPENSCLSGVLEDYGQVEDYVINVSSLVCDLGAPTGDDTQEFVDNDSTELFMMSFSQIIVETEENSVLNWYLNAQDAASGENPYTNDDFFTESGTYYVTQTVNNCVSAPFAVTVTIVLSKDVFSILNTKYYPNPVENVLNLDCDKNIIAIQVTNIVGQSVMNQSINKNNAKIDMSAFTSGTYMVKILFNDGQKTLKILKK